MNERNLQPFTKNDPRRINKPKGALSFKCLLKKIGKIRTIEKSIDGKYRRMTKAERLAIVMWDKALNGDTASAREILDRIDGKVSQPMEHTGIPLVPPQITFRGVAPKKEDGNECSSTSPIK